MLQQHIQKNFIKKVSLNATVALTTKIITSQVGETTLSTLGVCVHIDNSPIIISISEEQVFWEKYFIKHLHGII